MRSTYEQVVANNLSKVPGITYQYEEDKIPYTSYYIPDFKVFRKDGSFFYLETKGWFKDEDRLKMWRVKQDNPELDIRILFQRNGKLSKSRTYGDWCDKYGFPWSHGKDVPMEWLLEKGKGVKKNNSKKG